MNPLDTFSFSDETRTARVAQQLWTARPLRDRLHYVTECRRLLVDQRDALYNAVAADIGKRRDEVLAQELLPTAEAFRFLEKNAASILKPQRVPTRTRPMFLWGQRDTVYHRPHGIVAIIGTWNYPIFLNAVQIAQALTAGNAVLWKPSEVAPHTANALRLLFEEAGFPPGVFQTLPATREGGPQLLEADIDHLVFTGSAPVGRAIARRLGERLIPSTLELSGCDAMFVLEGANLEMAAQGAWFGAVLNRGQTCLATRRIMVHQSQYERFQEAMRPLAESALPVRLAMDSQRDRASQLVQLALSQGARYLVRPPVSPSDEFAPTILVDAKPEMEICRDAPFAPVAVIMPFTDIDDALAMDARCPYALGASIFTGDPALAEVLSARMRPGAITINDVIAPTAHPGTPFGGRGSSGWGVTQGPEGLLAMTVPQVVSRKGGSFRPHFQGVQQAEAGMEAVVEGALLWGHARTFGQRWKGMWQLISGARKIGRE